MYLQIRQLLNITRAVAEKGIYSIMELENRDAGQQNKVMGRKKDYNIECLRVISCFLVVCIHVANYYSRGYGEISTASYVFSLVVNGAARVAVPIFFMISGSLLLPEPVSLTKCLRRTVNALGALVLWSGIYLIWNYYYRDTEYDFRQLLDRPVKLHLWYLYVLIGIYLILPFLQSMISHISQSLYIYFTLLWFGFMIINELLFWQHMEVRYPVPMVGDACYLGYFVLGYFIKTALDHIPWRSITCGLLSAFCMAAAMVETLFATSKKGVHVEHFFEYRNIWIALGAILLFMAVLKNRTRQYSKRFQKIIDVISCHSFTIYLCHVLFLDIMKLELHPRRISAFVGIPLYVAGIFGAAFLFSLLWDGAWRKLKSYRQRAEMSGRREER